MATPFVGASAPYLVLMFFGILAYRVLAILAGCWMAKYTSIDEFRFENGSMTWRRNSDLGKGKGRQLPGRKSKSRRSRSP
jgi:hypothetical protein